MCLWWEYCIQHERRKTLAMTSNLQPYVRSRWEKKGWVILREGGTKNNGLLDLRDCPFWRRHGLQYMWTRAADGQRSSQCADKTKDMSQLNIGAETLLLMFNEQWEYLCKKAVWEIITGNKLYSVSFQEYCENLYVEWYGQQV